MSMPAVVSRGGIAPPAGPPGRAAAAGRAVRVQVLRTAARPDGLLAASVRRAASLRPAPGASLARRTAKGAIVMASAAAPDASCAPPSSCPRGDMWSVYKFGGTCVATPERIADAAKWIVEEQQKTGGRLMVVVSAMGSHPTSPVKTTDLLINMVKKAAEQDPNFAVDLEAIRGKHVETAKELLGEGPELSKFVSKLAEDMSNLKAMLQAISIAGIATRTFEDFVVGHGEIWSADLFAAVCRKMGANSFWMDARDVLVVSTSEDGAGVDPDYTRSNANLDEWVRARGSVPDVCVATGFIAKDHSGRATTLRRNGSDYSATIMGALLQAKSITIWTDVNGVYSADPRKVSEAVCLDHLSYHEAWELAYFGANVLHPRTTQPAMKSNIPITLRNFFNLEAPGTVIHTRREDDKASVAGFATIENCCLINVEGTGMVGVPGIASSIFSSVRDASINVIMISQASSEYSVCFAVRQEDGETAGRILRERFKDAINAGFISQIQVIEDCAVIAAVGEGMASRRGTAAEMFGALAADNINIKCIAQGCSEYNITALIDQKDITRALQAVHARFYLSNVPLAVGLVGPGLIGGTLLKQISEQREMLKEELGIDIRVVGVSSSKRMLLSESGVDLDNWKAEFEANSVDADLEKFGDFLNSCYIPNSVIVDTTASDVVGNMYQHWLSKGIHVCTANKKLSSGPVEVFNAVKSAQKDSYVHWFYEATVGAGLPIINTLKDLQRSGDKVKTIEGIFSGTLSYIFNTWPSEVSSFSECVLQARAQGFTEPDPRDDLNGLDVARKVCILARECGMMVELADIPVDNLVPEALRETESVDEYLKLLPDYDDVMAAKAAEAAEAGEVLRYVGVVDIANSKCAVELRRYPNSHAFATLSGSDNIILFTTSRYSQQPLIVRGPGAGAEVTAGGVFGDMLRLAGHLGGPSH